MATNLLEGIAFIVIGGISLYFATKPYRIPGYALDYAKNRPKAWIWRKMFGVERTAELITKVFAPLGITLSIVFVLFGVSALIFGYSLGLFS